MFDLKLGTIDQPSGHIKLTINRWGFPKSGAFEESKLGALNGKVGRGSVKVQGPEE